MDDSTPDQVKMWNQAHASGTHKRLRDNPNPFAVLAEADFPRASRVLDLGCGVGGDARYFEKHGHKVTATDISSVVIEQNRKYFSGSSIKFEILDISGVWPYSDETYDVVYSHLALHYYSDADTRKIFDKIWQVLKPNGILAFCCKSVNDQHHQRGGEELEPHFFVSKKGHVRHFFSEEYTRDILKNKFGIKLLGEVQENYTGDLSHIIRCIAHKA